MKTLLGLFAALKAFSLLSKFSWLFSFIPGVGPILGAIISAVGAFLRIVAKGLLGIVTNPANLLAAIVIAMAAVLFGLKLGVKLDAHLVKLAKQETREWKAAHAKLIQDAKVVDKDDKALFDKAVAARVAAELAARAKAPPAPLALVGPPNPPPAAKRVRKPAKGKPTASEGGDLQKGLQWFQGLFASPGKS